MYDFLLVINNKIPPILCHSKLTWNDAR